MKKHAPHFLTIAAALSASLACAQLPADPPPPPRDGPPQENRRPNGLPPGERGPRPEDGDRPGARPPEGRPPRENGPRAFAPAPMKPQPFLGVMTSPLGPVLSAQLGMSEGLGLVVEDVVPDSPAAKAGLQKHDVLKAVNDQLLANPGQLAALVRHFGKGSEVNVTVVRKGAEQKLAVKIGERAMPEWRAVDPADAMPRPPEERRRIRVQNGGGDDPARGPQDRPPQPPAPPQPGQPPRAGHEPGGRGGAADLRDWQYQSSTTRDIASARVTLKDDAGEMEVRSENGQRTLLAKDAQGVTVFNGPIDSEEQRQAVPEAFRKKLEKVDARTRLERRLSAPASEEAGVFDALSFDRIAPAAEPEIQ